MTDQNGCQAFVPHAFKKGICNLCFQDVSAHPSAPPISSSSLETSSSTEPDPPLILPSSAPPPPTAPRSQSSLRLRAISDDAEDATVIVATDPESYALNFPDLIIERPADPSHSEEGEEALVFQQGAFEEGSFEQDSQGALSFPQTPFDDSSSFDGESPYYDGESSYYDGESSYYDEGCSYNEEEASTEDPPHPPDEQMRSDASSPPLVVLPSGPPPPVAFRHRTGTSGKQAADRRAEGATSPFEGEGEKNKLRSLSASEESADLGISGGGDATSKSTDDLSSKAASPAAEFADLFPNKGISRYGSRISSSEFREADAAKQKTFMIASELLSTEATYVGCLGTLITLFVTPLREQSALDAQHKELLKVLNMTDTLASFHGTLLDMLRQRMANWNWGNSGLGDVFKTLVPYMKIYVEFINNYSQALEQLVQLQHKSKFAKLMKSIAASRSQPSSEQIEFNNLR